MVRTVWCESGLELIMSVDLPESTADGGRDTRGRWATGNPGRVRGSRNKVARATLQQVQSLTPKALTALEALVEQHQWKAVALVLSYSLPSGRPVEFESLDPADIAADLADGTLSIDEALKAAQALSNLAQVEDQRVLIERLEALENMLSAARASR